MIRFSDTKGGVTAREVRQFNAQWPCSTLRDCRGYWFEFDSSGDLVDTDCPESDDGPAALALSHDVQAWLETGEAPAWLY